MTHFADLAPCNYFPIDAGDKLLAVGWLDPDHQFPRKSVDDAVVFAMFNLLHNPWQPGAFAGRARCGFCRFSGGPDSFRLAGQNDQVSVGLSDLFVPGDGILYVAPSLVIHYIDAHQYCPPTEFQDAVLACPEMRSMEYLKAIITNGPKGIAGAGRPTGALPQSPAAPRRLDGDPDEP